MKILGRSLVLQPVHEERGGGVGGQKRGGGEGGRERGGRAAGRGGGGAPRERGQRGAGPEQRRGGGGGGRDRDRERRGVGGGGLRVQREREFPSGAVSVPVPATEGFETGHLQRRNYQAMCDNATSAHISLASRGPGFTLPATRLTWDSNTHVKTSHRLEPTR